MLAGFVVEGLAGNISVRTGCGRWCCVFGHERQQREVVGGELLDGRVEAQVEFTLFGGDARTKGSYLASSELIVKSERVGGSIGGRCLKNCETLARSFLDVGRSRFRFI